MAWCLVKHRDIFTFTYATFMATLQLVNISFGTWLIFVMTLDHYCLLLTSEVAQDCHVSMCEDCSVTSRTRLGYSVGLVQCSNNARCCLVNRLDRLKKLPIRMFDNGAGFRTRYHRNLLRTTMLCPMLIFKRNNCFVCNLFCIYLYD
jgi:hypothetical protein